MSASLWVGTSRSFLSASRPVPRTCLAHARRTYVVKAAPAKKTTVVSSAPEGTILAGIQYLKDGQPLIAKADDEYPPWLWTLVEDPSTAPTTTRKKGKTPAAAKGTVGRGTAKAEEPPEGVDAEQWRLQKEGEALTSERKEMRKENRAKIRQQNFMKTT